MPLRFYLSAGAALVGGAVACDNSGNGQGGAIRDSAGVTIMEHDSDSVLGVEHWFLSASPVLQVGASEGDDAYLFTRIVAAAHLASGKLVIADWTTRDLRVFDQAGQFVRRIGRRGMGPGEFQQLSWVGLDPSGNIAVHDGSIRRLTRFSGGGDLLQLVDLPSPPEAQGTSGSILGQFDDRSLLRRWFIGMPGENDLASLKTGLVRDSIGLYLVAGDGSSMQPVGRFLGREDVRVVGRVFMQRPAPFGLETVVAVADSLYYVGTQERYEVRAFRQNGDLHQIVRRRGRARPVSNELRAAWQAIRDSEVARMEASSRLPTEVIEAARYNTMPSTLPAFGAIQVDRSGNLWVQDFLPFPEQDSVTTWTVFGSDGGLRATATLPNLQITEIGDARVVLVWRDADGVPFVRVHELVKRRDE